jgi:flavin-binding protein dodecin
MNRACAHGIEKPHKSNPIARQCLQVSPQNAHKQTEMNMAENVYKVIELIGTSTVSWEKAAAAAIARAGKTLRDLRVAEVVELDIQLKDGKVEAYRAKIKVSFKYERGK